jgi:peptide deformylase
MENVEIVKYGEPVLSERAKEVDAITDEIRELIRKMYRIMEESNGVGLAANQIGVPLRIFTYDVGEGPHAIINPRIVRKLGSQVGVEGCLSVPGLQGDVERANIVTVEGLDENGNNVRVTGEGLLARVFQHEIDHLDGVVFIARADPETLEWVQMESDEESLEE